MSQRNNIKKSIAKKQQKCKTHSGNNKTECVEDPPSRGWLFTLNNYTTEEENSITQLTHPLFQKADKIVFGHEVAPKTGTPHLQGYMYFKNAISFESFRKALPRARVQKANGTPTDNYKYCTKDGNNIFEKGWEKKPKKYRQPDHLVPFHSEWQEALIEEIHDLWSDNQRRYGEYLEVYPEEDEF